MVEHVFLCISLDTFSYRFWMPLIYNSIDSNYLNKALKSHKNQLDG